jgi:hypothetical protein
VRSIRAPSGAPSSLASECSRTSLSVQPPARGLIGTKGDPHYWMIGRAASVADGLKSLRVQSIAQICDEDFAVLRHDCWLQLLGLRPCPSCGARCRPPEAIWLRR